MGDCETDCAGFAKVLQGSSVKINAGSLKNQLALPLFPARITAIVLSVFGLFAMTLAATGLFALVAYSVSRRKREIGIRMALGAQQRQVLSSVLGRTLMLCAIGVALGSTLIFGAGHLLSVVLYGVSPRDPVTVRYGYSADEWHRFACLLAACGSRHSH